MLALKNMLMVATIAAAGLAGTAAQAHEGCGGPSSCDRTWIPGHYETRMERMEEPGRWVYEEKVVESPGRYETKCEMVTISGRWETVERRVWVEARVVPATGAQARISVGGVRVGFGLPCTTVIPAHWETVCERVWVAPRCERREVQVWVPGCRRAEMVQVWKPGCVREVPRQVWVAGTHGASRCGDDRPTVTIGHKAGPRVVVSVPRTTRRHGW